MSQITCRLLSSLEKVFADTVPQGEEYVRGSLLQNEQFSFQLAVKPEQEAAVKLKVASPVGDSLRVFRVENVPCGTASYQGYEDDDYLRKEKGMYPDLLREYGGEAVRRLPPHSPRSGLQIDPLSGGTAPLRGEGGKKSLHGRTCHAAAFC